MKKYLIWSAPILVALAIIILFRTVLLLGYVPSESMEPTLEKGSLIVANRLYGDLEVGDIVVFEHEGTVMVKRIAAGPGEDITIEGINYSVPDSYYLMLGDNGKNSYDSRYWECPYVYEGKIIAKLIFKN